jgi:hypothetical protein
MTGFVIRTDRLRPTHRPGCYPRQDPPLHPNLDDRRLSTRPSRARQADQRISTAARQTGYEGASPAPLPYAVEGRVLRGQIALDRKARDGQRW